MSSDSKTKMSCLFKSLMGYVAITQSEEEAVQAIEEAAALEHFLGGASNAGLPQGTARLTFLPRHAFQKGSENNP